MSSDGAGLYIHVPFCLTRCGYCDFNTYVGLDHLKAPYVEALTREAELVCEEWHGVHFASIYLGGGTPTTLQPDAIARLLRRIRELFDVAVDAEITSEANPDTVDPEYLRQIRRAGVARLSIGVQSFDPTVLEALERVHAPESARAAYEAARTAGFDDVNLDLIYGANGETVASWRPTLEETTALGPDHVSAYALTIEPATALGRKVAAGLVPAPDPDLQAEMYDLACGLLGDAGYEHYEISNWAKPGHRSRHNSGYWEGRPYLGLGAGAHSYRDGRRWWNVRPPQEYLRLVGEGRSPVGGEEYLTDDDWRFERLLLGLRTTQGVPVDLVDVAAADELVDEGLAERTRDRVALAPRGLFMANDLVLRLARET